MFSRLLEAMRSDTRLDPAMVALASAHTAKLTHECAQAAEADTRPAGEVKRRITGKRSVSLVTLGAGRRAKVRITGKTSASKLKSPGGTSASGSSL